MTLIICALDAVEREIERARPARIVSLLSPDQLAPAAPNGVAHLVLRFHDIAEPRAGLIAPDRDMVARLLAFGAAWDEPAPMLAHCWMAISRSPAAALALACAADPARSETDLAEALRLASPTATPNRLIVALADDLLGRNGRLISAVAAIGRGAEASHGATFALSARCRGDAQDDVA